MLRMSYNKCFMKIMVEHLIFSEIKLRGNVEFCLIDWGHRHPINQLKKQNLVMA